ncbi:MAG: hypothetical protein RI911_421, partial [Candidatus Parcubacteria bacterium]
RLLDAGLANGSGVFTFQGERYMTARRLAKHLGESRTTTEKTQKAELLLCTHIDVFAHTDFTLAYKVSEAEEVPFFAERRQLRRDGWIAQNNGVCKKNGIAYAPLSVCEAILKTKKTEETPEETAVREYIAHSPRILYRIQARCLTGIETKRMIDRGEHTVDGFPIDAVRAAVYAFLTAGNAQV